MSHVGEGGVCPDPKCLSCFRGIKGQAFHPDLAVSPEIFPMKVGKPFRKKWVKKSCIVCKKRMIFGWNTSCFCSAGIARAATNAAAEFAAAILVNKELAPEIWMVAIKNLAHKGLQMILFICQNNNNFWTDFWPFYISEVLNFKFGVGDWMSSCLPCMESNHYWSDLRIF